MGATAAPPASALDLQEGLASRPGALDEDGNVLIHIIRPCRGLGKGRHVYTAEMLEANADAFTGWKMHIDHESAEARRARGGLPRSIRELGGRILESSWDPNVPAEGRYGQGAVVGKVKPIGQVKTIIEEDPELLEASIRAKATDVHPDPEDSSYWVVEGIRRSPMGSVDWVSDGGAGGRVVADLIEAMVQEADAEDTEDTEHAEGGDQVKELLEALQDPESSVAQAISGLVKDQATEIAEAKIGEMKEQHETELQEAKDAAKEEGLKEGRDEAEGLQKARDKAHELIEAAKIPDGSKTRLKARYDLDEDGQAKDDLVTDEKELAEAIQTDVEEIRLALAEANPAAVSGEGPSGGDAEKTRKPGRGTSEKPYHHEWLEETTGLDPEETWGAKEIQETPETKKTTEEAA